MAQDQIKPLHVLRFKRNLILLELDFKNKEDECKKISSDKLLQGSNNLYLNIWTGSYKKGV